ncbi:hypothetical protein B0H14DRAFT_3503777 [Mycena olivaceomarginata]|nr:hypothetical protein B0H14DRAFT_3503777 [Mycena olivaceomarginata]
MDFCTPGLPLTARKTPNSTTCEYIAYGRNMRALNGKHTRLTTLPLATLEVDNPTPGHPSRPVESNKGTTAPSAAPPDFSDRPRTVDIDADPFAPTYTLAHALPSGLITSSATPLTYDEDSDPEDESVQPQHTFYPTSSPASATSPPPPGSRSVSPAPVSPALSDDDMDEDTDNTPDYTKLVNDPGFGALTPTSRTENPHKPYRGFVASGPEDHAGVPFQKHSGGGAGLVMSHNHRHDERPAPRGRLHRRGSRLLHPLHPLPRRRPLQQKYRDAASDLTKYLEQITGAGGIEIYPPTPHEKGDFAGHVMYHPPWVLVGKCGSKEVRDELARHQLIACSRDLAVHVLKVDLLRKSWLLGHWRCNTLVPIPPAVLRAAVAIATFSQGPIRTAIVHATQNEEGTADERVYRFVQTLDVARLPSAAEPPLWIVYGKPCSESHAVWESIRDLFRNASFTKGLSEFTPIGSPSRSTGSNHPPPSALLYLQTRRPSLGHLPASRKPEMEELETTTAASVATSAPVGTDAHGGTSDGTTAQGIPVTGDGGYSAPGGHALNDRPEEEGDIAMGGAEDLTYRDEPGRASGMRGVDAPGTAPRARGEIAQSEELHAPQGPVQRGPVQMDEHAESANRTACARPPSREAGQPTADTENAAACAQTAESGNTEFNRNNAPVREAMNQYLDYLAGGAMLPPVLRTQEPQEDADMPPPEPELPAFMLIDTNDESWRREPLPPPPPAKSNPGRTRKQDNK